MEALESRQLLDGSGTLLFDFGPANSPVAAGYVAVTPATAYDPGRGYGWLPDAVSLAATDRGSSYAANVGDTDLWRDLNWTQRGTFAVAVPDGTYDVTVLLGDAAYGHDQMGVSLQGSRVDTVTTTWTDRFAVRTYRVAVGDGRLVGLSPFQRFLN